MYFQPYSSPWCIDSLVSINLLRQCIRTEPLKLMHPSFLLLFSPVRLWLLHSSSLWGEGRMSPTSGLIEGLALIAVLHLKNIKLPSCFRQETWQPKGNKEYAEELAGCVLNCIGECVYSIMYASFAGEQCFLVLSLKLCTPFLILSIAARRLKLALWIKIQI